ncbi:glycosyltransferase family 4 protein [Nannocystis punicea]|uniref:Glycosyltransferase family 4 protein n=1 Tax=Nannocystis punicea TaxID=2995304 RepID=A0ABY7GX49_9BACT|nr:glycosyltransferase family 4 protein [Nannocystis poenicansa]WAS91389.1 glycosyltransferase family 4 protein [Nannocystis poenicansa]
MHSYRPTLPTATELFALQAQLEAFRPEWVRLLPEFVRLFDEEFYAQELARLGLEVPEEPLILDYLRNGGSTLASPHPLFDAAYYCEIHRDVSDSGTNPLAHYLVSGSREGRRFHPLFDLRRYLAFDPVIAQRGLVPPLHYLQGGWARGFVPTTVFEHASYDLGARRRVREDLDPYVDYLAHDFRTAHDPVPLASEVAELVTRHPRIEERVDELLTVFDRDFYGTQLERRGERSTTPVLHYFAAGAAHGLDPNPLFDTDWFATKLAATLDPDENVLAQFLRMPPLPENSFHPLFHEGEFRREMALVDPSWTKANRETNSLVAYLRLAPARRPTPNRLFKRGFYVRTNPDVDLAGKDPFLHYLTSGHAEDRWPNPVFDPEFYRRQIENLAPEHELLLGDLAARPPHRRPRTTPFHDPAFYERNYIHEPKDCPVTHILEHGCAGGRAPNQLISLPYIWSSWPERSFQGESGFVEYFEARLAARRSGLRRPRILIVGHDGGRTGAPAIMLGVVKWLSRNLDVECISVLDVGGPLVEELEQVSHVFVKQKHRSQLWSGRVSQADFDGELADLLDLFADDPPVLAICNSAETWPYVRYFAQRGVPIVSLIHEFAEFYPASTIAALVEDSSRLICPAMFVAARLGRAAPASTTKSVVYPQGLTRDNFGRSHWGTRARLLGAHGVEEGDIVVMGCGTADGRKGIDIFVDIARQVLSRVAGDKRVFFIWLGATFDKDYLKGNRALPAEWDTSKYWAVWDYRAAGLEERVKFIPPVGDPEAYFACSDIFLLTSRADPFPLVVQEAMACALPVIAFAESGGAPEALAEGAGIVVAPFDRVAMADRLVELVEDEALRAAIGARAERRVRATYRFGEYSERIVSVCEDVLGSKLPRLGLAASPATASGRRWPVYFAVGAADPAASLGFCERIAGALDPDVFDAQALFVAGRFTPASTRAERTTIRHRFLQPRRDDAAARQASLDLAIRPSAPCVLVDVDGAVSPAGAAQLPSGVALIAIAEDTHVSTIARVAALAPYCNAIVASSPGVRDALEQASGDCRDKVFVIDALDCGSERRRRDIAACVESVKASVETKSYVRPTPKGASGLVR